MDELNFWKVNLVYINSVPLWPIKRKPSRIVYSDASISACGSFIALDGKIGPTSRDPRVLRFVTS